MKFDSFEKFFAGNLGKSVYSDIENTVVNFSMGDKIKQGVLVGLSGGADSVLLLNFLVEYRKKCALDFCILAVHINHMIRGDEADRDETFSKELANFLNVEFISRKINVPTLANELGGSLEEVARNARYKEFNNIIRGRNDISCIAVAHNSSDNLETVLFNMLRGTGTRGLAGIPPVRENIVRPLISIPKKTIRDLFTEANAPFMVDSTNESSDYSRNYIRNEIIPLFEKLNPTPENAINRLTANLRQDSDYLELEARDFILKNLHEGRIKLSQLQALHPAILYRVLAAFAKSGGVLTLEAVHINSISKLLNGGDFKLSLPGNFVFISERGECFIMPDEKKADFNFPLVSGVNEFPGFSDLIILSTEKVNVSYPNVYKFSILVKLNFDIINCPLRIRSKNDGDSYKYGKITRKIKKLFNDKKLPQTKKADVPILTVDGNIVFVPGFSVADEYKGDKCFYLNVFEKKDKEDNDRSFFFPI